MSLQGPVGEQQERVIVMRHSAILVGPYSQSMVQAIFASRPAPRYGA